MTEKTKSNKMIIVSNRLPVSISKENGKLVYANSSGGLATAMSTLKTDGFEKIWIGWPGIPSDDLTPADRRAITRKLKADGCYPVFLTRKQVDNFYSGYANDTIWPLFHYFQTYAQYNSEYWLAYKEVNDIFKRAVLRHAKSNSTIWIHDYHLMLLPQMLRKVLPDSAIGFFLHIPFPTYEIFRQLPNRNEVLDGLLGADLLGFHIYDYALHFLNSVQRARGYGNKHGSIVVGSRVVQVDAFPIGIDYEKFVNATKSEDCTAALSTLNNHYQNQKIILSVDRLDYSKGIIKRLEAFDKLLKENPEYIKKVTLVIVAVPSRIEVETYKDLRETIELAVSHINGAYSTVDWTPISYQFKNIPFVELVALYDKADIALVTPLRDGMNLVAKEFVAAKKYSQKGVLILSEMAGAIDELHEAVRVNPNDINSITKSIKTSLRMPKNEQRQRLDSMNDRLSRYTVQTWAADFINQLDHVKQMRLDLTKKILSGSDAREIVDKYVNSGKRVLLLDYDGTLANFHNDFAPALAAPSRKVLNILRRLTDHKANNVYIISGRPHETLEKWFGKLTINLVAEHGAWVKLDGSWHQQPSSFHKHKDDIMTIMSKLVERTPGAKIEEKTSSLVWHYRNVPTELAYRRKATLIRELNAVVNKNELGIHQGNEIIEVKSISASKGKVARRVIKDKSPDFILCIGDDYTDEDMFEALAKNSVTIKVGLGDTAAKFQLENVENVIRLLNKLSVAAA